MKHWGGGREGNGFGSLGEFPDREPAEPLLCDAGNQTIPTTWGNGFSFPPQSLHQRAHCVHSLCSPIPTHPFFHVGSLRAAKQRDFLNFMYCKCHSYKQDEKRTQPLCPLQTHSCRGTACARAVARPLSLQTGSSAPH